MTDWHPRIITQSVETLGTSLGTARVETDEGPAYFKPLDNPEGPHALASEWIGTALAAWLGLDTFAISMIDYDGKAQVLRKDGRPVDPGPGIVIRHEEGFTTTDDPALLRKLANLESVSQMVLFDTWIRNRDRFLSGREPNYGNLFLSRENAPKGKYRLVAMDHTHCFANQCELTPRLQERHIVGDDRIFGLFPGFVPLLRLAALEACCARLLTIKPEFLDRQMAQIPEPWQVDQKTRAAWSAMILERSRFVATSAVSRLEREYPHQLSANME